MPDTTYISIDDTIKLGTNGLPDSIVTQINEVIRGNEVTNNNGKTFLHLLPFIFLLIIAAYVVIKVGVVLLDSIKEKIEKWFGIYLNANGNHEEISYANAHIGKQNNYWVYDASNLDLTNADVTYILEKHYTYYRNLNRDLQYKFYDRLMKFMHSKQFIIHSDEPFKEMPVLISAAAVQISFGLDSFEFPHYPYIQIHKEEYFAENSMRVLAGNVQGSCITLAWNQLLKGFGNYEDGNNVGLHEMAHALYFQEIVVDKDDDSFELHFNELMYKGETVLEQKKCPHDLYTDYAFTNLQEFWAVSVELFFERASDLYNHYPRVFDALKDILKQNPVLANQPVYN